MKRYKSTKPEAVPSANTPVSYPFPPAAEILHSGLEFVQTSGVPTRSLAHSQGRSHTLQQSEFQIYLKTWKF